MNAHPQKWYIPLTEENYDEVKSWWLKQVEKSGWGGKRTPPHDGLVLSEHPFDSSHYWSAPTGFSIQFPTYQKITLEQFRQITNSTPIPMPKTIQISRQLLNEYYDAATTPQREYLAEHFKLDGTTTDEAIRELHAMACDTWKPRIKKNHPDCFPEESKYFNFSGYVDSNGFNILKQGAGNRLGMGNCFIQIRHNEGNPETHMRSFYLDTSYNWELKQDGSDDGGPVYVLIPTKKLS